MFLRPVNTQLVEIGVDDKIGFCGTFKLERGAVVDFVGRLN